MKNRYKIKYNKRKLNKNNKIKVTDIVNSSALLMQILIAFLSLFFVIIPGQKIIEKDSLIRSISEEKIEVETEYNFVKEQNKTLQTEYERLINLNNDLDIKIKESKKSLADIQDNLYNAELTILIDDFLEYISLYKFKSNDSIHASINRLNRVLSGDYNEVYDKDEIFPNLNLFYNSDHFYKQYTFFSKEFKNSKLYEHTKLSYSNLYNDIEEAISKYSPPDNISNNTIVIFIQYLKNILQTNKTFIIHINDLSFINLEKDWNAIRNILYKYKNYNFIDYIDYIEEFKKNPKTDYYVKYSNSKKKLNEIEEQLSKYNLSWSLNEYFYTHSTVIKDILLIDIDTLYKS